MLNQLKTRIKLSRILHHSNSKASCARPCNTLPHRFASELYHTFINFDPPHHCSTLLGQVIMPRTGQSINCAPVCVRIELPQ